MSFCLPNFDDVWYALYFSWGSVLYKEEKYHTDFVKVLSLWFDNNVIESAYLLPEHFLYTPQQQSSWGSYINRNLIPENKAVSVLPALSPCLWQLVVGPDEEQHQKKKKEKQKMKKKQQPQSIAKDRKRNLPFLLLK